MPVPPLDDRALEALLSGAPSAQSGFDWLIPFVEDLGEASSGSAPAMTPALALLVAEGISTEKGDLPATAASNVTGPAPQAAGLPKWRKKMLITELLAGLAAKFAGLGMVAKAGLGLTLAAASTTAAGAAGVLPAPAQHAVATVVDAATPFSFPDETKDKANFGATVSADATGASDGVPGVDGQTVSDAARNKSKPDDTSVTPGGNGVGANTGAKGLDRANETPAAGNVPTSVPGGGGAGVVPGAPAASGLGTASSTPAAGKVPTSVPPVIPAAPATAGAPGNSGLDTAGATPAAGRVPPRR
ncbi:MAG TPA: hypothetical protein VGV86_05930 [Acidimicrobiales bacterium]|nr:hypothetical protein [Acidimicrobiales bacterium]